MLSAARQKVLTIVCAAPIITLYYLALQMLLDGVLKKKLSGMLFFSWATSMPMLAKKAKQISREVSNKLVVHVTKAQINSTMGKK